MNFRKLKYFNFFLYALVFTFIAYNITSITRTVTTNFVTQKITKDFARQMECLAKNIYYEAGSESYEGKLAVAQVTLNRVESGRFAPDICGVVYQKDRINNAVVCQFSWACQDVGNIRNKYVWEESQIIAKRAMTEDVLHKELAKNNAMYFHASYVKPEWSNMRVVAKIGNHVFYNKK